MEGNPSPRTSTNPPSRLGPDWIETQEGRSEFQLATSHELLHAFAQGSYGKVWLARSATGAWRAIKFVFRRNFKNQTPYDREFRGMLKFEPISRLHHGFVDILHVGRDDEAGFFFYIMELGDDQQAAQQIDPSRYEPRTLASELERKGRLPLEQCLSYGISLADALGCLHQQGLVHRDIKPSNVIFVNGVPKLADIGLVTAAGADVSFVGTDGYIPREGPGSASADIYSLGKVIYEISTGRDRKDFPELPAEVLQDESRRQQFLELNEILLRACAEDVTQRYQRAEEMHAHLALLQAGKSVKGLIRLERAGAWLKRYWAVAAILFVLANLVFFLGFRESKRNAENRQRQAGSYVGYGTRLLQEGDLAGALPWFVAGRQLDRREPLNDATHDLRLTSALRQSPRIVQMWFHAGQLRNGQFGPDSATVLIPAPDGRSGIYRVDNGRLISPLLGVTNYMQRAVWNPQFNRVVTSFGASGASICDPVSGQEIVSIPNDGGITLFACFDPAGERLLTVGFDGVANVWDARAVEPPERPLATFSRGTKGLWHGAWSPDGSRIVTSCEDGVAAVWDVASSNLVQAFSNHRVSATGAWIYHAVFSPDGRRVASGGGDRTARVWETDTGREVLHPIEHRGFVSSVEFSHDGRLLLTADWSGFVRVFRADTGKPVLPPMRHGRQVQVAKAVFSPDDRFVLTMAYDGFIRVWKLPEPIQPENAIFSPDGRLVAHVGEKSLEVTDVPTGALRAALSLPHPLEGAPLFSVDGRVLLASWLAPKTTHRVVGAWKTAGGDVVGPFITTDGPFSRLRLDDAGHVLALSSRTNLAVYDLATGQKRFAHVFDRGDIASVALDRAGERVAVGSGNGVQFYRVADGAALLDEPLQHPMEVRHIEFSPRNDRFLTACANGNLDAGSGRVWDARTYQPLTPPMRHRDGVMIATFSADGKLVATGGEDNTAMIWDAATGMPRPFPPLEHDKGVNQVAFSHHNRWLATASMEGVVRAWDVLTGAPLTPPLRHPKSIAGLVFAADDKALSVLATGDGQPQSWRYDLAGPGWDDGELALTAQLLSGQRLPSVEQSVGSTNDVVRESWEQLRARTAHSATTAKPPAR